MSFVQGTIKHFVERKWGTRIEKMSHPFIFSLITEAYSLFRTTCVTAHDCDTLPNNSEKERNSEGINSEKKNPKRYAILITYKWVLTYQV